MRRHIVFDTAGAQCVGTLDDAAGTAGLLIVSGGNEIRSGAHGGQAAMAAHFAALGHPVFRYDRRGIGDSSGHNSGFAATADDIAAAAAAFRSAAPHMQHVIAFGNCDAATALALFQEQSASNALILANPWVIEDDADDADDADDGGDDAGEDDTGNRLPAAAAIRARYWARIKNPRSYTDLLTGKINLGKLWRGLAKASQSQTPSGLAQRLAGALNEPGLPVRLLIAQRDSTAAAFLAAWQSDGFAAARASDTIAISQIDSASHSFASSDDKEWLYAQIHSVLAAI